MVLRIAASIPSYWPFFFLTSSRRPQRPSTSARTSPRVGSSSSVTSPLRKSRRWKVRSESRVIVSMLPLPSVVRSIVGSWQTISSPSAVRCTSISTISEPSSIPFARQDMEFSVPSSAPPRWAITAGVFPCLADMGSTDCAEDVNGRQTRAPRTASKEAGFIY